MNELDDFQLDGDREAEKSVPPLAEEAAAPPESAARDARAARSSPPMAAVLAVVAALVALALLYFWFFDRQPPPPQIEPAPESEATAPRPPERLEGEAIEEAELPPLDASDEVVRGLVSGLSARPQLAAWLVTDDLARRFVVAIDNMAEGVAPRSHLGFLAPVGDFEVEANAGRQTIAEDSFERYDLATEVFTSLDTEGSVRLFRRLEPLLQQAYVELGYPSRDFEDTLLRALAVIVETPRPPAVIEVTPAVTSYEFADPRLENLSPIEKQLLRLGPENLERVQSKAAELAAALAAG